MDGGRRQGGKSVLLVDDDAAVADVYRTGLEAFGFRVRVAPDGPGFLLAVEVEVPDIIVLDWQLPGMRGDELLELVRLDPRTRSLPVFMLSNLPAERDGEVDRVFLAGALAWLQKIKTPPALLAQKLEEALRADRPS